MTKDTWRVIVSRMSCAGKALEDWPLIANLLKNANVPFSERITDHKYHAIEIAAESLAEGYRKFIVIGGDGAIHEVLNGVFSQKEVSPSEVTFAIIPVGSGNDWARLHKIPSDYYEAVNFIARGESVVRYQDVARVKTMMDGRPYCRYMINIGGLGFDSEVCHRFDIAKSRGHAGDKQYLKALVTGFIFSKYLKFKIKVDGKAAFEGPALSVALGLGKYCGGGMMQTPAAEFDDGQIDVTVVGKMPKIKFLTEVRRLYDGTIFESKHVTHYRGKLIEISASPYSYMEVDGEPVGITPVSVEVIPNAVKVVSNY
ncbi:MAG: diacylglycerol kinase family lipid kinase [Bacteroidales bacterium]|nr:diacylglycerol kinase family lipid kinase [Candidatus Cacconaster merdequi]